MAAQIARDPTHPTRWGATVFWGLLAAVMIVGAAVVATRSGWVALPGEGRAGAGAAARRSAPATP